ncbi:MAG TPA: YhfC family glutamic-type intramembrane protease [Candidatus Acidoferrum sp.]|nr:YhfC family glutamic-type intramembrane protease [Candidatus Acidoferrum sp.]
MYALQPIIVIIICSVLMVFWYLKQHFHASVWAYSAIAYFVAIALKYAVQLPTSDIIITDFGAHSATLGIYYGLQTVAFEVGLAYLIAWYAISHRKLEQKDAEAFGSGLAFYENAIYLGALSLVSIIGIYAVLSTNTPAAQTVYNQLITNQPGLFAPAFQALGSVAVGTVERISSLLFHFAWGYLCVMAVVYNKKRLFLIALPMGFVDFLVPFATSSNVNLFEGVVFGLATISVIVAWYAVKQVRKNLEKLNSHP